MKLSITLVKSMIWIFHLRDHYTSTQHTTSHNHHWKIWFLISFFSFICIQNLSFVQPFMYFQNPSYFYRFSFNEDLRTVDENTIANIINFNLRHSNKEVQVIGYWLFNVLRDVSNMKCPTFLSNNSYY